MVCVHGFGANADHWRKNLPELGRTCRTFAIDLLGALGGVAVALGLLMLCFSSLGRTCRAFAIDLLGALRLGGGELERWGSASRSDASVWHRSTLCFCPRFPAPVRCTCTGQSLAIVCAGYGYSDKPASQEPNTIYTFPNWSLLLQDFIVEKVGEPAFLTCNSGES